MQLGFHTKSLYDAILSASRLGRLGFLAKSLFGALSPHARHGKDKPF